MSALNRGVIIFILAAGALFAAGGMALAGPFVLDDEAGHIASPMQTDAQQGEQPSPTGTINAAGQPPPEMEMDVSCQELVEIGALFERPGAPMLAEIRQKLPSDHFWKNELPLAKKCAASLTASSTEPAQTTSINIAPQSPER